MTMTETDQPTKSAEEVAATELLVGILSRVDEADEDAFRRALARYVDAVRHVAHQGCSMQSRDVRDAANQLGEFGVLSSSDMSALHAHSKFIKDPSEIITLPNHKDAAA